MDTLLSLYEKFSTEINTFVGILGSILCGAFVIPYLNRRRMDKEEKTQKKLQLDTLFQDYLGGIYIPMNVKDTQSGDNVFPFFEHFVEIIHQRPLQSRYICLLGDIGSGKSAALAHLHHWYINKYREKSSTPTDIRLYTLNKGYKKLMDRIDAEIPLRDRSNCILLLDALDECDEACASLENTQKNNPRKFMEKLGKDTADFAWVVVSCRRQFFQSEEFLPGSTGVSVGAHGFGSIQRWRELILEPFNHEQVESFLVRHFGVGQNPLKDEAIRIIYNCDKVFLRPLILSNIDIIIEQYGDRQEPLTMKEIFDTIILNWIRREAKGDESKRKEVLNASLCIAAYMYKHNLNYLNDANYMAMCKEHGINDQGNLLRLQSLLTNDKDGFRFAHQSFYEHLLAYWFFLHPGDIDSLQGLLESTVPAYKEILDEDKKNPTEMSKLLKIVTVNDNTLAVGLCNIGIELYRLNHFCEAESFYHKALEIYKALEKDHPGGFIDDVAMVLNNLSSLHIDINHYDEAEEELDEALKICRELADRNPDTYMLDVADMLNNLAGLHFRSNRQDKAEEELDEALKIYRELVGKDPDVYIPHIVEMLNNLATLHYNTNRQDEAEKEYDEALKIYRELADKNPDAYMPGVADTMESLAALHYNTGRYNEAEKEYNEVMKIHRELADKNPDAYMPVVAGTLNSIAVLHYNTSRYDEAEKEYDEALKIYRELADKNPDAYMPGVADTLNNMATFYKNEGELTKAWEKAQESLEIYLKMAELNHDVFDKYVKKGKDLLTSIRMQILRAQSIF